MISDNSWLPTQAPNMDEMPEAPNSSTESPTATPATLQPTFSSVVEAEYPLSGQISLRLGGITTAFPGEARLLFLATADEFMAISSASKEIGVKDIRVMLLFQSMIDLEDEDMNVPSNDRRLDDEEVLEVDLGVDGLAHKESFSDAQWNDWLQDSFESNSWEFVALLQEMGDDEGTTFFDRLKTVQVMEPAQPIRTNVVPSPVPTSVPTPSPTRSPVLMATTTMTINAGEEGQAGVDEGALLLVIIAAAVGGLIFLMIGVMLIRYAMVASYRKGGPSSSGGTSLAALADNFGASDEQAPNTNSRSNMQSIQPEPSIGGSSSSSESYLTNSGDHHMNFATATMTSGNYLRQPAPVLESDNASQMGGTSSGDMSQMDNVSYAYSLEPGIEPSVAGVPQSVAASAMSFYTGGSSVASMTSGASSFALPKHKNRSSGGGNIAGKPTTDILAPPGKLGLVLDTSLDGPVVHEVILGSALEGKLKSGDIIVAIDDVDTRAMSVSSISTLMAKTANQRRKLTIVSPKQRRKLSIVSPY